MVGYFLKSERLPKKKKKQLITFMMSSLKKESKIKEKTLNVPARSQTLGSGSGVPLSNHFAVLAYSVCT